LCKSQKKFDGDPGNDKTSVWGEKHELYTESPTSQKPKKARQAKGKVRSMLIIFFDFKGILQKEFVLVGQTVNSAYYCDVLRRLRENVAKTVPELWLQKNSLLQHDNASSHISFLTRTFLIKKQHGCCPHPTYFSVSPIEDKAERPPF
jgi:hypothetical protein